MARSSSVDALEKFRFFVTFLSGEASPQDRAGFFEVQLPKRSTTKISYREGDDPDIQSLSAGLSTMEDIVLTRGLIKYAGTGSALYRWMSAVHTPGNTPKGPGVKGPTSERPVGEARVQYRKDIRITILDRSGKAARIYELYNAWPTNFVPGSDMNAGEDGDKSLESITLAYEDFREYSAIATGTAAAVAAAASGDPASPTT